jgi:hypothetical protein
VPHRGDAAERHLAYALEVVDRRLAACRGLQDLGGDVRPGAIVSASNMAAIKLSTSLDHAGENSRPHVNAGLGSASADSLEILLIGPLPADGIYLLHQEPKGIKGIARGRGDSIVAVSSACRLSLTAASRSRQNLPTPPLHSRSRAAPLLIREW